jgi:hypothetical protein
MTNSIFLYVSNIFRTHKGAATFNTTTLGLLIINITNGISTLSIKSFSVTTYNKIIHSA